MKNIIILKIISFVLFVSFSANAGIIVYDGDGNEKDVGYLKAQGISHPGVNKPLTSATQIGSDSQHTNGGNVPYPGELKEEDLKHMSKKDFTKYIMQVPDSHRNIEDQKIKGLGTIVFFTDSKSASKSLTKVINEVAEFKNEGLKFKLFLKEPKAFSAMMLIANKFGGDLKEELVIDRQGRNARRLHVDMYPQMIYLGADGSKARYAGNSSGLMALKLKIGEVKTMLQLQEREKQGSAY